MQPINPIFQYVADLPVSMGRPVGMCSYRGDVLICMESGKLLRLEEDFYTAQFHVREIKL